MKELIDQLMDAIDKAQRACVTQQAPDNRDVGYHFGRLQGTHTGLLQSLKIVENFLNEIDQQEESNAEHESR